MTDAAAIEPSPPPHVRPAWAPLTLVAFVALVICSNVASAVWARWVNTNPEGLLLLSSRNRYLALTLAAGVSLGFYVVIGFLRIGCCVRRVPPDRPGVSRRRDRAGSASTSV